MNEDVLNMKIRKFIDKVGAASQREYAFLGKLACKPDFLPKARSRIMRNPLTVQAMTQGCVSVAFHSPLRPPDLCNRRTSSMTMPRSTALHIS
jgi:hypothetical protein